MLNDDVSAEEASNLNSNMAPSVTYPYSRNIQARNYFHGRVYGHFSSQKVLLEILNHACGEGDFRFIVGVRG